jgi:GT2 family glycosyltransferase
MNSSPPQVQESSASGVSPGGETNGRVSVVVAGLNRARFLGDCLQSLSQVRGPIFEVIYVDGGSTDGSLEIAKGHSQVRIIKGDRKGVAHNRNLGASVARGEYLHFLDDDAKVASNAYDTAIRMFENSEIGVVGYCISSVESPTRILYSGLAFLGSTFIPIREPIPPGRQSWITFQVIGTSFVIRRSLFEALGGFDENLLPYGGEDLDLCWRAWQRAVSVVMIDSLVQHKTHGTNLTVTSNRAVEQNLAYNVANYLLIYMKNGSISTLFQLPVIGLWILRYPLRRGFPLAIPRALVYFLSLVTRGHTSLTRSRNRIQEARRLSDSQIRRKIKGGTRQESGIRTCSE